MRVLCVCVQIQSGLGKLILKEEMEKEQIRERHARSLSAQRYDPKQTNCDAGTGQLHQLFALESAVYADTRPVLYIQYTSHVSLKVQCVRIGHLSKPYLKQLQGQYMIRVTANCC